jgi:serine/threonine protein kinase
MTKRGRFDSKSEDNPFAVCPYVRDNSEILNARDLVQNAGNSLVRRTDRDKQDHLYQIIAYFLRNNCKVPENGQLNNQEILKQIENYCIQLNLDFQPIKLSFANKYFHNALAKVLQNNTIPQAGLRSGFRAKQRLNNEFEIIEELGKGGFGKVYKCRHLLDEKIFAVKKIEIDPHDISFGKMRREVTLASDFDHPHVVKYVTSWVDTEEIEKLPDIVELSSDSKDDEVFTDRFRRQVSMRSSPQEVLMNSGNAIEWAGEDSWASTLTDEDGDSSPEDHELLNSASPFVESIPESENSAQLVQFGYRSNSIRSSRLSSGNHRNTSELEVKYTLCIQMEFCTFSLRRYLVDRNEFIMGFFENSTDEIAREKTDGYVRESFEIATHIINGIEYLHKKGCIHRDIKPENILWNEDRKLWQICDFGLATQSEPPKNDRS